ncbi:prostatic acid phosphatase-like isoform X2 [Agrilus planipennis]|uniref:acid phosphatase n=1 Tax=Agrilus planipennis TaxID=224129 RepID=A0A1W4WUK1_AGRPL|nr:prostatic acid phosphatase-like isoform X2 [Agrilus planipennis]
METANVVALNFICLLPILFCYSLPLTSSDYDVSEGLILLHVIHRHGDRTADTTTYPNDPYKNYTFFPPGVGQLTNIGKKRMYEVGKDLRRRYNNFLGEDYYPDILYARTTDVDRTKMSLQLSLAGLFPPDQKSQLDPQLNWQPIPYNYEPWKTDHVLGIASVFCPKYNILSRQYVENLNMTIKEIVLFNYLSTHTGFDLIDTIMKTTIIYSALKTQEEWGFEPPSWIPGVWEKPLKELAIKNFARLTATKELAKLAGADTMSKINGSLIPQNRKLFLYSAHDYNLASILGTLGVFPNKLPNYGSQVIIEVRYVDGEYGMQILFQDNEGDPSPELLTIPGCTPFCPLNDFIKLTNEIIPEDESVCNIDV